MKTKRTIISISVVIGMALTACNSLALQYGTDITVYDGKSKPEFWYGSAEDGEVEPGNARGQYWDLESFRVSGDLLTLISGYDLSTPVIADRRPGHLFLDVDGDIKYGAAADLTGFGHTAIYNSFGYDYVLTLDYSTLTYSVYALDATAELVSIRLERNQTSNAWRYTDGGTLVDGLENVSFAFTGPLTDAQVDGLAGGVHYATTVDLSFLSPDSGYTAHFTIGCGNDVIIGHKVPDAGSAAVLLGLALLLTERMRTRARAC